MCIRYSSQSPPVLGPVNMTELELREFSLETNNLPIPEPYQGNILRNRFNRWKHIRNIINGRQDYQLLEPNNEDVAIDIPAEETVNELTPLIGEGLAGTVTTGAAAAATATTDGIIAGAAAATAGAAIVGGIGYGIHKLTERTKEKGLVLPKSEYIGPGNPIPISAAKSKPDQIAKDHDVGYANLIQEAKEHPMTKDEFVNKLHTLDLTAIQQFEEEYKQSGSWQAYVGAKGLKIKHTIEKITGPIYPPYKKDFNHQDIQDALKTTTVSPAELEQISVHNKDNPKHISHKSINIIKTKKGTLDVKQMRKLHKAANEYVQTRTIIIANIFRHTYVNKCNNYRIIKKRN